MPLVYHIYLNEGAHYNGWDADKLRKRIGFLALLWETLQMLV